MNGPRGWIVAVALAVSLGTGCARPGHLPERPMPIAWADTLPIAEPVEREPGEIAQLIPTAVSGELSDVLGLRALTGVRREALNVDHFDDVPPSAWFEHRIRARPMSPADVRRGPTTNDGPASGPLTIVAAKVQGISPGYTIEDTRGDRYVVKFDPKGFLYLSSAAGVISNRLFYAAGYHVPEDYIFRFTTDRLRVEPGATIEGDDFVERPLTLEVARDALSRTDSLPDGSYVAVASKFVPGPPKGPFFFHGRRDDDPNDHYQHQHRRDLRGLYVVSSWINHVDMRFANTLDAYVPPGYLRHYLIDFAATLGSGTIRPHEPREGLEYNFDLWDTLGRIFTLGFHRAGWEGVEGKPLHPSIGWLRGEDFDPEQWKPNWPNAAFKNLTIRDGYWGAKLVGSFTPEQVRAAVAAGGLPDETAAARLAELLLIRRDTIVRLWYGRVSPVEDVAMEETRDAGSLAVSFTDLGLAHGAWSYADSRYDWTLTTPSGVEHRGSGAAANRADRVFLVLPGVGRPPPSSAAGSYATLDIRIRRGNGELEPRAARVYLRAADNGYEVAGLEH